MTRHSSRTPSYGLRLPVLVLSVLSLILLSPCSEARTSQQRDIEESYRTRDFTTLSSNSIQDLLKLDPQPWTDVNERHLGRLLIPRASGSENNTLVQNYISSIFSKLGWHEEKTPFTSTTPIGEISFTNLIYTFDPSAPRKVVLAAHFDSKWFPSFPANQFIGATDSAAPCAMLLDLAEALTPLLQAQQKSLKINDEEGSIFDDFDERDRTTLQIVFFDGEEAFHDWTDTDSIYGARYLAEEWSETYLPPTHPLTRKRRLSPAPTILNTIDHLILLDLLGDEKSTIYSYYRETDWLHSQLRSADIRLRELGLTDEGEQKGEWFPEHRMRSGMIGDDHVPFLHRGVSILHVISSPFPKVWHTLADDASALSLPALKRWNGILRIFTAEYLGLTPTATATANEHLRDVKETDLNTNEIMKHDDL